MIVRIVATISSNALNIFIYVIDCEDCVNNLILINNNPYDFVKIIFIIYKY